jgi:hypothetical protein
MKVLSIDVGIKNLAFCILARPESVMQIEKWGVIDLSEEVNHTCSVIEKGAPCFKPAKFKKDSLCFCLKHSKKQTYQIPTNELKPAYINKQKIQTLYDIADKYKISYEKPIKKSDLTNLINEYIHETCFEPILKINASKLDLVTIAHNLQQKFDEVLEDDFSEITNVIIENQIGPLANRMKSIQGMLVQYFIMRNCTTAIEFVNASNKLKSADNIKSDDNSYKDRKKIGIQKCLEVLNDNIELQKWIQYFSSHKKKDDLSDAFLQGLWYMYKKK